jgi:hypothetical protein
VLGISGTVRHSGGDQKGINSWATQRQIQVGATFDRVYNGNFFYVLWNDQFYDHPEVAGNGSWGHSKGLIAWNQEGEGFVCK